jgi:hypothetical protein
VRAALPPPTTKQLLDSGKLDATPLLLLADDAHILGEVLGIHLKDQDEDGERDEINLEHSLDGRHREEVDPEQPERREHCHQRRDDG